MFIGKSDGERVNEYVKEEKKKTTDWPTFHRVLLKKSGEYLFFI